MKLEDQVCSLELSQKLLTLGVKQNILFCWYGEGEPKKVMLNSVYDSECNPHYKICSAFTADDLGEIIPNHVVINENQPFNCFRINITKFISVDEKLNKTNNWIVNYHCDSTEITGEEAWLARKLMPNIYDPNLANAMAKMLIYLIENGLMKNEHNFSGYI